MIDASAHAKQGNETPGVQRPWCGESGKIDNCVDWADVTGVGVRPARQWPGNNLIEGL